MGASTGAAGRGESRSPKNSNNPSPPRQESTLDSKAHDAGLKPDLTNGEVAKPLAPPPRPAPQQGNNTPDFFGTGLGGSLSLEPNPFEQSFGSAPRDTPGKLPSVAALTSPSSLLPGSGTTPFEWGGGSLRAGPLSPAMLSGPATQDYFGDTHGHIRGSFPTPNESSLRSGLTPGGSGSMFPAPSPNTQALFNQLATPGTIDFHRTALSAAAAKREAQAQAQAQASQSVTSQPQEALNGNAPVKPEAKAPTGPFDPHDNDAANGLFMLAQGRNGTQPQTQPYPPPPPQPVAHAHPAPVAPIQQVNNVPHMNGNGAVQHNSVRGVSETGSAGSDESEQARPNTRSKGKKGSGGVATNGRRKAEDPPGKTPASKKAKTNGGGVGGGDGSFDDMDDHSDEDMDHKTDENGMKTKMTDEEKRKNFLERNRVAALKCRQRKKQWLANLQSKVEMYSSENDALTAQISQLREEVVNLKTLLLAHKDCPVTVTQQQGGGFGGPLMQQTLEPYNPQMNPYGMAAPIPQQPVMAGQVDRRFS